VVVTTGSGLQPTIPHFSTDCLLNSSFRVWLGDKQCSYCVIKPVRCMPCDHVCYPSRSRTGTALMGIGTGRGKDRAVDAALSAISSPLLGFPISQV
jgi:hypothetical protein